MPDAEKTTRRLEIAHVLFMDIVGYSKLLMDDQRESLHELNTLVLATDAVREADAAGQLIRLPTGDGMALVFTGSVEAPAECALQLSQALRAQPSLPLRMGLHSGPVQHVADVNGRENIAGAGINIAQRVMDCGDAGHILVSKRVADDLATSRHWLPYLHELGDCEVKHGVVVSVVNLYADVVGNAVPPVRFGGAKAAGRKPSPAGTRPPALARRWLFGVGALTVVAALTFAGWRWSVSRPAVPAAVAPGLPAPANVAVPAASAAPEKSIAVLPFENLSDDKQDGYFSDGVQDEILTDLAKVADLKVISRTSVMVYKDPAKRSNLREIGKALGVAYVVEGSVQHAGNRIRVTAQLIDARTDVHKWAERYDRDLADVFMIQSDVARSIAVALQAKLAPREQARLESQPAENPQAYLLYLEANALVQVGASLEDALRTDKLYTQAMAQDPHFAPSRARASILNSLMYSVGRDPLRKSKARALADESLRLAPDLGEGHLALGLCYYRLDADYAGALRELAVAGDTLPNESEIFGFSGDIYCQQGRWREALAAYAREKELDPLRAHFEGQPTTLRLLRDWKAAEDAYKQALQLEPRVPAGWAGLAYVQFARTGLPSAASATLDGASDVIKAKVYMVSAWNYAMLARDFAGAEKMLSDIPADDFPAIEARPYYEAVIAFVRRDRERARALFEQIRPEYESALRDHPDDALFHAALGKLYALLGRKEEAVREARRAVELCPEEKSAVEAPEYAADLAEVYAQCGQEDQAVSLLTRLLTTPAANRITLAHLRLSWEWDPLRQNPQFKALLEGPEPKTTYK